MKLVIDARKCQGHGRCVLVSMDLFDVDDDGNGVVLVEHPGESAADDARKAVSSCPEQAVSYQ